MKLGSKKDKPLTAKELFREDDPDQESKLLHIVYNPDRFVYI